MASSTFIKIVPRIYKSNKFLFYPKQLILSNQILNNFHYSQWRCNKNSLLVNNTRRTLPDLQKKYSQKMDTEKKEVEVKPEEQQQQSFFNLTQKLKTTIAEYGTIVMVFHVGFALASLATIYAIISSGVDMQAFLARFLSDEASHKIAANAGTFALAYAINKLISPIRILITLTVTPFIVRYLRRIGFIKHIKKVSKKVK